MRIYNGERLRNRIFKNSPRDSKGQPRLRTTGLSKYRLCSFSGICRLNVLNMSSHYRKKNKRLTCNLSCEVNANHNCVTEKQNLFGALFYFKIYANFVLYSVLYSFLPLFLFSI